MIILADSIAIPNDYAAMIVVSAVGLAIGVIALLTWSVRNMTSISKAMSSTMEINAGLNEELRASYAQRRELREMNERLDRDNKRLEGRISALEKALRMEQADKEKLKEELKVLVAQGEKLDSEHEEIVRALTNRIEQLKKDVESEKKARQQMEERVALLESERNALRSERDALRLERDELAAEQAKTVRRVAELEREVAALKAQNEIEAPREEPGETAADTPEVSTDG